MAHASGGDGGDRARIESRAARRHCARFAAIFFVAIMLTAPLLAQMLLMFMPGTSHEELLPRVVQLALATPVQFLVGSALLTSAHGTR